MPPPAAPLKPLPRDSSRRWKKPFPSANNRLSARAGTADISRHLSSCPPREVPVMSHHQRLGPRTFVAVVSELSAAGLGPEPGAPPGFPSLVGLGTLQSLLRPDTQVCAAGRVPAACAEPYRQQAAAHGVDASAVVALPLPAAPDGMKP